MKRYYEFEAESDCGIGIGYFEFTGRWVSRQIEFYKNKVRWAELTGHSGLWAERVVSSESDRRICDLPFEDLELKDEEEISQDHFEEKWKEAKSIATESYGPN